MAENVSRKLVLGDGRAFYGQAFGAPGEALCQLVFNTSMVGYQEIASDPAGVGQAVVMTYPLIGNYGMADMGERRRVCVGALVVRDYNDRPSNFRYSRTLGDILEEDGVPGISGVDTRELTRIIRDQGAQPCLITDADTPPEVCADKLAGYRPPEAPVARVGCRRPWYARTANPRLSAVTIDCGIRGEVIRHLGAARVNVAVMPHTATAQEVLAHKPHGLLLSGGPGDPRALPGLVELVGQLRGRLPIFGICLGGQVVALSYGAQVEAMHCGHRGGNHPVESLGDGLVEITSQNHGYVIRRESLAAAGLTETHRSLLDGTVEGVCHPGDRAWAVQFHPEDAPGPQGGTNFLGRFVQLMQTQREEREGKLA